MPIFFAYLFIQTYTHQLEKMDENVMISPQLVWWTRFKPTISPIRYVLLKLAVKKHLWYLIKIAQFCIAFFLYKQNLFCVMIYKNCPNLLQHHNCFINDYFLILSIYYIFYHQCRMITTLFIMRWNNVNDFFYYFFGKTLNTPNVVLQFLTLIL